MSNLLVGCRASGRSQKDGFDLEGIIVRTCDAGIQIMTSEGKIVTPFTSSIVIHPDDVKFINGLSASHKFKQKILTEISDRFEILDL